MASPPPLPRPTLSHRIEYLAVLVARFLLAIPPKGAHGTIVRILSLLWFYCVPIRKKVVLENLGRAFPEMDVGQRRRTARKCLEHFAHMMVFDSLAIARRGGRALEYLMARVEGEEYSDAAGLGKKPVIIVGGHLGNWELCASYYAAVKGVRLAAVTKPIHNPLIEKLLARGREAGRWETIPTRGNPLPRIIQAVREEKSLLLLADQDAGKDGMDVPFFSIPASTPLGPAMLAYRLKMPILVCFCLRSAADGRYTARFYPPLYPDFAADRRSEVERLTREHVALLEQCVREAPEQYFWFHRRWKTGLRRAK